MFKDTVEDAVCCMFSIAEPWPMFGPEEQYISGVCNYSLLTMCQVYHCVIRVSSHFLKDVSGTDCGLLVTLRICYTFGRSAVFSPAYSRQNLPAIYCQLYISLQFKMHTQGYRLTEESEADLLTVVVTGGC